MNPKKHLSPLAQGIALVAACFLIWTAPLQAAEVLIYSTSHNNLGTSVLNSGSGTLVVEVSAMGQIEEIYFNGEKVAFKGQDRTQLRLPYKVGKGFSELNLEVVTSEGTVERDFPVIYGKAPQGGAKDPLRLGLMGGLNYSTNVANVPDDQAEAGAWADLLFLPGYKLDLGGSLVDFAGIFLWEKYLDADQAQQEVVLSQVSAGYLNPSLMGKWKLEGGYRNFGTENDGLTAKTDEGSETFVGGKGPLDLGVPLLFSARWTQRVLTNGGSEGYDPNGNLFQLRADWRSRGGSTVHGLYGGFDLMDAQGQYKDYQALRLGYGLDLTFSPVLSSTLAYDLKKTDYTTSDPSYDKAESNLRHSLSGQGTYRFKGLSGLAAIGQLGYETRSSNLDARAYSTFLLKASALYSF